jgi:hypothetical protein
VFGSAYTHIRKKAELNVLVIKTDKLTCVLTKNLLILLLHQNDGLPQKKAALAGDIVEDHVGDFVAKNILMQQNQLCGRHCLRLARAKNIMLL